MIGAIDAIGGLLLLVVVWGALLARLLASGVRVAAPRFQPAWLSNALRRLPSWRLFAQRGPAYDLYPVVGDRAEGEVGWHHHLESARTRTWGAWGYDPESRHRYLLRSISEIVFRRTLVPTESLPSPVLAEELLLAAGRARVRRAHPADHGGREVIVSIVFDPGHVADTPPHVVRALGPVRC